MNRSEFDQLVRSVEKRFDGKPAALRRKTLFWALVGLGLLWLPDIMGLLVGLGLAVGSLFAPAGEGWVAGSAGAVLAVFCGGRIVRTLRAKSTPPPGIPLGPENAPGLFALLEELGRTTSARPFEGVRLTWAYNAAVVSQPRFGWPGWSRSWLVIGLPLLDSLSDGEFRAVLAHELAHHSARHGRLGSWLYRTRRSWELVFARWNEHGVRKRDHRLTFFRWFWPRFNGHAFVLSRTCEFEADAFAAGIAGAEVLGSALHRIALGSRRMEARIWPAIWEEARTHSSPPARIFERIADHLAEADISPEAAFDRVEVLRQATGNHDTHPCLRERLRALGFDSDVEMPGQTVATGITESAAQAVFAAGLRAHREAVETEWRSHIAEIWGAQHRGAAYREGTLDGGENAGVESRSAAVVEALWDRAAAMLALGDRSAAESALAAVLKARPDHPRANLVFGERLLQRRDESGIARVEDAMRADPGLRAAGFSALGNYYHSTGQTGRLKELEARLDREERGPENGCADLTTVASTDTFAPVRLDSDEQTALTALCAGLEGIDRVTLVEKALPGHTGERLFVVVIEGARGRWGRVNRDAVDAATRRLLTAIRLPGRVFVCAAHGAFAGVAAKVSTTAGAWIWSPGMAAADAASAPHPN